MVCYGEVRGASDFKRVFSGMFFELWTTVLLSVIFLTLFAKTFGWSFYQSASVLWMDSLYGIPTAHALPIFPSPVLLADWLVHNTAFQVILILLMSLCFFGWVGTLFLSSTPVIFAAAFDRTLPDGHRRGDPAVAQAGTVAGPRRRRGFGYSGCRWCPRPAW